MKKGERDSYAVSRHPIAGLQMAAAISEPPVIGSKRRELLSVSLTGAPLFWAESLAERFEFTDVQTCPLARLSLMESDIRDGSVAVVTLLTESLVESQEPVARLRKISNAVTIVVLADSVAEDEAIDLLDVGADDVISTEDAPFRLHRAMKTAMSARKAKSDLAHRTSVLEGLFQHLPAGLVVLDAKGTTLDENESASTLVGFFPKDVPCQEWADQGTMFLPDRKTKLPTMDLPFSKALRGKVAQSDDIFCQHAAQLDGIMVSISAIPIRDEEDEKTIGAIGVIRDVTAYKELTNKVRSKEQELARRIKERLEEFEEFGFRMSRNLKTPLQIIERECMKLTDKDVSEIRDIVAQVVQAQAALKALLKLSQTPRTEMRHKLGLDN